MNVYCLVFWFAHLATVEQVIIMLSLTMNWQQRRTMRQKAQRTSAVRKEAETKGAGRLHATRRIADDGWIRNRKQHKIVQKSNKLEQSMNFDAASPNLERT